MSHPGTLGPPTSEQSAQWTWTGVIVGLLVIQLGMSGVAIFLATGDPTNVVVPNYHQHALEWDQVAALRKQSQALGWTWRVSVAPLGDVYGKRQLVLELRDPAGLPVVGAAVTLNAWHHARAGDPLPITLTPAPDQPGVYVATVLLRRSGLWHVDVHIQRDGQHFVDARDFDWQLK
jgi:nitrogen fixation protein FixH